MKRSIVLILLSTLVLLPFDVGGQEKKTTDVTVTGHIYEPAKLEPTEARIKQLRLPAGFSIHKFAEIQNPRMMVVAPGGTIYVSQREPGTVSMLKDTDGDGVADLQRVVAAKEKLHGLAIHQGKMYLAAVREVYVADINQDETLGALRPIITDLPDGGQHPNRTLAIGPDGMLYISIGSTCNACNESNPENATLLRADLEGRNRKIFASGLRNTIGFGWHPVSRTLYGFDHGIDWLGDEEQNEEVNELVEGAKYGWPHVYGKGGINPQGEPPPALGLTKQDWARQSKDPVLLYTPHSAPMQMVYYTGAMFPAEYKNEGFIAMRGSWNRNPPSGYEVVRVKFDQAGKPVGVEPFLTGFLVKGGGPDGKDGHFARLAGTAIARDGALLVSDDTNNIIYRISYGGTSAQNSLTGRQNITYLLPEARSAPETIKISSANFGQNQPIPDIHSAYGQEQSPALSFSNVPTGTKSLVLMMEDPDAFSPKPVVHWLMANIPAAITSLPPGLAKTDKLAQLGNAVQGGNHTGRVGYFGPRPPAGDPAHHYHFQLFALDTQLQLPLGFNRQMLLNAMRNHVIGRGQIVGTYQRLPRQEGASAGR